MGGLEVSDQKMIRYFAMLQMEEITVGAALVAIECEALAMAWLTDPTPSPASRLPQNLISSQ
jgi:hypothetical protein